jgi:SAM-dependent methyltransferase
MSLETLLLEQPLVYRLWQATHAAQKLAPIRAHNDLRTVRRVLDVGCGPGTNTPLFGGADYLGLDINPAYIEYARHKFNRSYVVADVTKYEVPPGEGFDFILINSFLHHVDTSAVRRILSHVRTLLAPGGHVHIVEVVLPRRTSLARMMAKWDRGEFPRPLEKWRTLLSESLDLVVFEPFPVKMLGVTSWIMVYCKGRAIS